MFNHSAKILRGITIVLCIIGMIAAFVCCLAIGITLAAAHYGGAGLVIAFVILGIILAALVWIGNLYLLAVLDAMCDIRDIKNAVAPKAEDNAPEA